MRWALPIPVVAAALLAAGVAHAATAIPEEPDPSPPVEFAGEAATPRPIGGEDPPRHPFMASNGRSNIHNDAWMTDSYSGAGPLGRKLSRVSTYFNAECASVTFDSRDRIVTICVGVQRPTLRVLDPATLDTLAEMELPPRDPSTLPSLFRDFSGGGYFYLDERDRAIVPTNDRHLYVVSVSADGRELKRERDYDLGTAVADGDKIISALPDWSGRVWFATTRGVTGTVDLATGAVRSLPLGEEIQNSFAVDEEGGVYIVTIKALYRLDAGADGTPVRTWRVEYPNSGISKPGQVDAGSGTTPTLFGNGLVAITDNADPMDIIVYRRGRAASREPICVQPVFEKGASATDNSLIAAGRSLIVENNYGYTGPAAVLEGRSTTPGIQRVDLRRGGGCSIAWTSDEVSPTVVPKLSLANGLVYAYTKAPGDNGDPWYLTALDFRSGRTIWKRLAGRGLGFNNNYAPVSLGPDGAAYVGVLGGLVSLRDASAPPQPPRLDLRARRSRGRVALSVAGADAGQVTGVVFTLDGRRVASDKRAPFAARAKLRCGRGNATARAKVSLRDGRLFPFEQAVPRACRRG